MMKSDTEVRRQSVEEKLPWHAPQILRLEVTLDTRDTGGSQGDGEFGTLADFN